MGSNEYIKKEVDVIVNGNEFQKPQSFAMAAAWIIGNFKGLNLKVLDVRETSSLSDYFVLASATNPTQAKSISNEIVRQLSRHGLKPISLEGTVGSDWVLLDMGQILVHIFQERARQSYDLDELWGKAPSVSIPQSYYFSDDSLDQEEEEKKSYF